MREGLRRGALEGSRRRHGENRPGKPAGAASGAGNSVDTAAKSSVKYLEAMGNRPFARSKKE